MNLAKDDDRNNTYANCSAYEDKTKYLENLKQGDFVKIFGQVKLVLITSERNIKMFVFYLLSS